MKGFKKDGKFRPTEKKRSGITKEKFKHKSNNPFKEMRIAYKKHFDDKKRDDLKKDKIEKIVEDNADEFDVSIKVLKEIQKLEGGDVLISKNELGMNSLRDDEGRYLTLSNKATYNLYENYEDMENEAKERIETDLMEEPSMFNQDWLSGYLEISDYQKQEIADSEDEYLDETLNEEFEDKARENARERVEEELAKMGKKHDEITDEELVDGEDSYYGEELDKLVLPEKEKRKQDIISELDDPVQYFVRDHGIYTVEDLLKQPFINIDYDKAVVDAISRDGVEHFLSSYDGNSYETDDGQYLVKHNN